MFKKNKKNYAAWGIKVDDFPHNSTLNEQIKFLLNFALLAPSGHNSQPWELKLKDNTILIFKNQKRFLIEHDAQGRQCYISIGCLIENLIIAADYFGFETKINYFSSNQQDRLVANITLTKNLLETKNPQHLINYITRRVSDKNKYSGVEPQSQIIEDLSKGAPPEINIVAATGETKNALAKIIIEAQIQVMDKDNFRKELSNFIKSNTTKSYYGMPGFTIGIPGPISFIASKLIKIFNLSKLTKKQDLDLLINNTPTIFVITTGSDYPLNWINCGRFLENLWLQLTKQGFVCAPWAGAVQLPIFREKVKKLLNLQSYPQVILRCGYPKTLARHSPRFSLEKLIIN